MNAEAWVGGAATIPQAKGNRRDANKHRGLHRPTFLRVYRVSAVERWSPEAAQHGSAFGDGTAGTAEKCNGPPKKSKGRTFVRPAHTQEQCQFPRCPGCAGVTAKIDGVILA